MKQNTSKMKTVDMAYIAICVVLITVCSWISIPAVVPFTLQTFAVFCTLGLLGGKRGTIAVIVYILLGAVGLPVFHGFMGGFGVLLGTTGGYLAGFIFSAMTYWLITSIFGTKTPVMAAAMVFGLMVCYLLGTVWFMVVYARTTGPVGFVAALSWCVFPFIIPDLIKIGLALVLTKRLAKLINRQQNT